MKLECYKIYDDALLPTFATKQSACFDLYSYLPLNTNLISFSIQNEKILIPCCSIRDNKKFITITQGFRVLVPTGLILNITQGYSVRIHARSGLSLKHGMVLANGEGIIDSDYIDPLFIMITNISMKPYKLFHGERIAQGELVKSLDYSLDVMYDKPIRTDSTRTGGFGSTGTS